MKEDLKKIINNYGVIYQLEHLQSEVLELYEAIIIKENEVYQEKHSKEQKEHIAEELSDNFVMLFQFPLYYYERLDDYITEPYVFETDYYEHIEDVSEYFKEEVRKSIFKLNCVVIRAEEREQDYVCEYHYKDIIEAVDEVAYRLASIKEYYGISDFWVERIMKEKIERQLGRIENENSK